MFVQQVHWILVINRIRVGKQVRVHMLSTKHKDYLS